MLGRWSGVFSESINATLHLAPLERQSSLLSELPPNDTWIQQGIVERRTVHANVVWRERQMILTKNYIYFARIESNLIVDKIQIRDICSIGKVDHAVNGSADERHGPNGKQSKLRRNSSVLRTEKFESFNDNLKETFAFEIKTISENFQRSYFVRVQTLAECDRWVQLVNSCLKSTLREHAEKHSWLEKKQRLVREFQSDLRFRYLIAFFILMDFLSCVLKSELLPLDDTQMHNFFDILDRILFIGFGSELLLNVFGNWRTARGSPFVLHFSNWFQVATVLVEVIGFAVPAVSSLKVMRIMRLVRLAPLTRLPVAAPCASHELP